MAKIVECGTCKFFVARDDSHRGACHRYPEIAIKDSGSFCGEYQRRVLPEFPIPLGTFQPLRKAKKKNAVRKRTK